MMVTPLPGYKAKRKRTRRKDTNRWFAHGVELATASVSVLSETDQVERSSTTWLRFARSSILAEMLLVSGRAYLFRRHKFAIYQ